MSKKILTITIPAYNVAEYLEETVRSLTRSKYVDKLEILIVNDGSKDATAKIGRKLEEECPSVRLIDKKNGGHGSTINAGIKEATGKYFRLLDGDDWFDTAEFDKFVARLLDEDVDLVLTDLVERYLQAGVSKPVTYYATVPAETELDLSTQVFSLWGATLPTTTIKTRLLKKFGLEIDEHCFYVDQEYNLMCYISAKTAKYYPLMIYQYRLEREGQSMQKSSLIRNVKSHEKVCMRLLSEYEKYRGRLPEAKRNYLERRVIVPMCHMQYAIAIDYCRSRKAFSSFDKKLKKFPEFYDDPGVAGSILKFHRKTSGAFVKLDGSLQTLARMTGRISPRKLVSLAARPATWVVRWSDFIMLGLVGALMAIYSAWLWPVVILMLAYVGIVKAWGLKVEFGMGRELVRKVIKLGAKLGIVLVITIVLAVIIKK